MFRQDEDEAGVAVFWNFCAVFSAYMLWILGTLVFSSILFIGTLNALSVVVRYLVSALVCRMILLVEMARIRGVQPTKNAQQSSS